MKKICIGLWMLLLSCPTVLAQDHTILLFEEFIVGKIHFKNHSTTSTRMNYDAGRARMLFLQDGELMEVTNQSMIDSISFGKRQFIPTQTGFSEKVQTRHGVVYVNWRIKDVHLGSKGAYGMPTQGKVETLNNYDFGLSSEFYTSYGDQKVHSNDVFRRKNANTYSILWEGKLKEIRNLSQLIKLLPEYKDTIKAYAKEKNLDMKETIEAIELIDYCLSLKK